MILVRIGHAAPDQAHQCIVVTGIRIVVAVSEELDAGPDQESPENHKGEGEVRQRNCTDRDQNCPQKEGQDHPDQENPLMQIGRRTELRQNDEKDKEVVDTEGLLHDVGGEELGSDGRALPHDERYTEGDSDRDVEHRPHGSFPKAHVMWLATDQDKIQGHQYDQANNRGDPHADRNVHL